MKFSPLLALAALSAPVLVAHSDSGETIQFAPKAGTSLTKTFTLTSSSELDELNVLMNGEESPMTPDMEMGNTTIRTLVVVDEYGESEAGQPLSLKRTYEKINLDLSMPVSMDMMGEEMSMDMHGTGTSALEGREVAFKWDADAEAYAKSFADEGDVEESLLEELLEDMDLRGLLPEGEVAEGDSWEIEPVHLIDVLFAGGDVQFEVESDGDEPPQGMGSPEDNPALRTGWEDLDGSQAKATLKEIREVDGARIAEIVLSCEMEATADMVEFAEEQIGKSMPEGMAVEIGSADSESVFEGKGILLWNLSAGHAHSLTLEGPVGSALAQSFSIDAGGQSMEFEQEMEFSGTYNLEVTFE